MPWLLIYTTKTKTKNIRQVKNVDGMFLIYLELRNTRKSDFSFRPCWMLTVAYITLIGIWWAYTRIELTLMYLWSTVAPVFVYRPNWCTDDYKNVTKQWVTRKYWTAAPLSSLFDSRSLSLVWAVAVLFRLYLLPLRYIVSYISRGAAVLGCVAVVKIHPTTTVYLTNQNPPGSRGKQRGNHSADNEGDQLGPV